MKNRINFLTILGLATASVFMALIYLTQGFHHKPQIGDVYVSYIDNRNDEYALTNGFAAEHIEIIKITEVANGKVFWSSRGVNIHPMTNSPGTFPGGFGPVSNFLKHKQHHTLVKASPKSK